MMKILLVSPSQKNIYGTPIRQVYPQLGLLLIAAVLEKEGHRIEVIDFDNDKFTKKKYVSLLEKSDFNAVGLTSITSTINHAKSIAKLTKAVCNAHVILGGAHATIAPEESIKDPYIDFVIKGEGEKSIIDLITVLNNESNYLNTIDGLYYKKEGRIFKNKDRELIQDLDEIPFPARHLLKNFYSYCPPDYLREPVASIITSRGCSHNCTYCCSKQILGGKFRFRSVKNTTDEIEYLIKRFGVKEIHIMDDCFTVNKNRVLDFKDEIKKRGINVTFSFGNGLRADQVDKEILLALKEIGVFSVGYGVESGNQTILNNIKKGIKLETIRKAFRLSKEFGLETWGFFIIGLPGETIRTIKDTINFAKELNPDFAKFLILKPFPGSEVFNQLSKDGLITDFNYDHYGLYTPPVHKLPNLSQKKILKWEKRAYREFYLHFSKIIQHLKRIKSFTQLKSNINSALFILKKMFTIY